MRNTKLWAVLLAFVLLCGCVLGILFTGANAEGEIVYGVGYTEGIDEDKQFDTIRDAFAAVETAIGAGEWVEGNTLVIKFAGSIEAKVENSELVFGQKTIFTSTGKKLPIKIVGAAGDKTDTITVTADRIACANDYTFENLKIDINTADASFFAGSGQVNFKTIATVNATEAVSGKAAVGRFYADNYTAEAFAGWTKADMEALMDEDRTILTSLTFDGFAYYGSNDNAYAASIAAVGASRDTDEYSAAASDDATFVITPASTKAKLHWMSGSTYRLGGYSQAKPARVHTAHVWVTGGIVAMVTGDESSSTKNEIENGNIDIKLENVKINGTVPIRVLHGTGSTITNTTSDPAEYGNVNVYAKNVSPSASGKKATEYYMSGSNGQQVAGKVTVEIDSCVGGDTTIANNSVKFIGLLGLQGTYNKISNTNIDTYSATRISAKSLTVNSEIKNEFVNAIQSGGTVNLTGYSSHNDANVAGAAFNVQTVTNVFTGCTFSGASIYAAGSASKVDTLSTTIDSCDFSAKEFLSVSDSSTAEPEIENVTITLKETVADKTTSFKDDTFYGYYNSSNTTKITGDLTINVEGGTYPKYIAAHGKTVGGKIINRFKGGSVTTAFYGCFNSTATAVENHLTGGTLKSVYGTYNENGKLTTIPSVLNKLEGANTNGFNGTYRTNVTDKVENIVTAGTHTGGFYCAFGHQDTAIGDVVNKLSGGTISGDFMSAYGATSIKSVENTFSGTVNFSNSGKMLCGGPGNNNWTSKVLGNVTNNFEGGTFSCVVYGGARSANICGDVINNVKSGTFNSDFYGGNFAPVYYRSGYTYYESFKNKGIDGTIYNVIGEEGKTDTAPVFNGSFIAGDRGDNSANAYANRSNCTIVNTVYNGTFNGNYTGANGGTAYRTKHSDQTAYSITLSVTNNIHGGTFKKLFTACSPYGAFIAADGEVAATVSQATVKNNIYGGVFEGNYFGGHGSTVATMNIDVTNHFFGGTLKSTDNYLGHGNDTTTYGTITNIFEKDFKADTAYVYGAGGGIVHPAEGETVAVVNTINGGTFTGFWGAGGNANLIVNADVETTVYGGNFNNYGSPANQLNGITGGPRNGILNGKATLTIYDGTFVGQVCGGSLVGSSDYYERLINGSTELNIYGGNFKRSVFACSPTATITATGGSIINIVPTVGTELAFYSQVKDITTFDASSDVVVNIGKNTLLEIASLTGSLKVNQTQQWLARTYVTVADAEAEIVYTTADGVLGSASLITTDSATELRGNGINIKAATLLLSGKIKIKLMFDENDIASLPADYEFTFTAENGTVLGTVNAENIGEAKDGYYTVVLSALGLGDFDMAIACEGNYLYSSEMTVIGLADLGAKHYTETAPNAVNAQLFKTIADLGRKANEQEAQYGNPVTEAVNWTASKAPEALDSTRLNMQTIGLVMTDAIGVRLDGETVAADTPLQFWVNGVNVTSSCVITRDENADETSGKFGFTVDMYVNVSKMTTELSIVVTDDAQVPMFTMTARVDALAEKIYATNQAEITNFALAYIQAADAYIKAQGV